MISGYRGSPDATVPYSISHFDLFSERHCVLLVYTQIANRALQARMTQQQLDSAEIFAFSVD